MWTAKEKLLKEKGRQICFTSILWYSTKAAFLFSLTIEFLQLFLRLGTFQLLDLCYNTFGGAIGGVLYWMGWKVKKR
ncbi:MAG: VanZ family protein [Anaerobutyricum soehngenii]